MGISSESTVGCLSAGSATTGGCAQALRRKPAKPGIRRLHIYTLSYKSQLYLLLFAFRFFGEKQRLAVSY